LAGGADPLVSGGRLEPPILISTDIDGWAFRGSRDDMQVRPYRVAREALADVVRGNNWWI